MSETNAGTTPGGSVVGLRPRARALPAVAGGFEGDEAAVLAAADPVRQAVGRMMMHASGGQAPPGPAGMADAGAVLQADLLASAALAARLPHAAAERSRAEAVVLGRSMDARLPAAFSKDVEIEIAVGAGERMGLDASSLLEIRAGVELLPLARFGLPDRTLLAPAPLCPADWAEVHSLVVEAARLIAHVPGLAGTAAVVLAARERADGSGYPFQHDAADIPCESAIVGACEAYRALRSPRPWREGCTRPAALETLLSGGGFDPAVVDAVAAVAAQLD